MTPDIHVVRRALVIGVIECVGMVWAAGQEKPHTAAPRVAKFAVSLTHDEGLTKEIAAEQATMPQNAVIKKVVQVLYPNKLYVATM